MQATVIRCDCGNAATDVLANGAPACEWCAFHEGHEMPSNVRSRYGVFGGLVAECSSCCAVVAHYWECGCDLVHVCA